MAHLLDAADARMHGSATAQNYATGYNLYCDLCYATFISIHPSLTSAADNLQRLKMFIEHCFARKSMRASGPLAVATVDSYVSAIKYIWRINNGGVAPPLHHGGISILLADARARSTRIVKERRGLTVHFLRALVAADAPIWILAPIATAYHFFTRPGEVCQTKDETKVQWQKHIARCSSLVITDTTATLTLIHRKNLNTGKACTYTRFENKAEPTICIVNILRRYIAWRATVTTTPAPDADAYEAAVDTDSAPPAGPATEFLFVSPTGRVLQRKDFVRGIKQAATARGLEKSFYSGHSCRIGAAQAAFAARCSIAYIMAQGYWLTFSGLQPYLRHDPANDVAETTYFLTSAAPPPTERTSRSAQDADIELLTTTRKRHRHAHDSDDDEQLELESDDDCDDE
jgi:hypothetical protein